LFLSDKNRRIEAFLFYRSKEQNYQRYREERFRATSDSTNQRVLWWSVAQLLVLITAGFWQMRHLRGFFEAKKLV
jgi:uncharacterized beta-barrel protein YwiB (DUF1934 family)